MRWRALVATAAVVVLGSCAERGAPGESKTLVVFAAASTTDVLREGGRRFQAESGIEVVLSCDASSSLARQIRAGAPADVFVSADQAWMDDLDASGLIDRASRQDLLANELALIAPRGRGFDAPIRADFDFASRLPHVDRIAIGDPQHVPAGRYAQQALVALGWWDSVQPRIIPARDVRAALRLVEIGEADAGIVYASDAMRSSRVEMVATFPANLHEPIRYPVALCTDTSGGAAFIELLQSAQMRQVFEDAGFRVLSAPRGTDG